MAEEARSDRGFLIGGMIAVAILSSLPMVLGVLLAPKGAQFLGYPYATDDHMVYAAWMRQAQDGRFFMDNRFAIDPQPGLTVHLYFWVLGLISKIFGIAWTTTIAKAGCSALFVWLTHKLLTRLSLDEFARKIALTLVVFGSGFGFLVWHCFGEEIVKDAPGFLANFLQGRLPVDVWQPEGFVFSSMLTNSLFMASLCLILGVILAILDAEKSWKPVGYGALCMLVLMNVHSYDSLLLGLVAVAFVIAMAVRKRMTGAWLARGAVIFAGAIPSALWISHVLKNDPVFQARAETLTYSPNFRQVVVGYGLLLIIGVVGLILNNKSRSSRVGAGLFCATIIAMVYASGTPTNGYFLAGPAFIAVLLAAIAASALCAEDDATASLIICWALVGLVAIYFPALFQRKLAMGLSIPWAILAARWLGTKLSSMNQDFRRTVTALCFVAFCLTSFFWLQREIYFIRQDVSRTTVQPLYLTKEMTEMIDALNSRSSERRVVLVMPGIANFGTDEHGEPAPDHFGSPIWPDLNPIISGLSGAYTFAGHWSETPNYGVRRKQTQLFFMARSSPSDRRIIAEESGANYAIGPMPGAFGVGGRSAFVDIAQFGEVLVSGREFQLVKIDPAKLQD